MKVSIDEAEGQLARLVRVMETGEEVVFTRGGKTAAKLVAATHQPTHAEKMAAMEEIRASARRKATHGPDTARLTRDGRSAGSKKPTAEEKRALIEELQAQARKTAFPGPSAARSQDFLYGDDGLPR